MTEHPDPSFDPDCRACDLDMHRCPGCGKGLNHGINVCLRCRNELMSIDESSNG